MKNKKTIRIGTRDSELALWQSVWVQKRLNEIFPDFKIELIKIKTKGDIILDQPLAKIGDKGLFTKELDRAMLENKIDLSVNSMKDVPTELPDGLIIAAVTERWDTHDVLITRNGETLDELADDATIATGSLRRKAQLLNYKPNLKIVDIRGNLNTRLKKFHKSDWDGMLLARAGVERLGWKDVPYKTIPFDIMLPAVGQGSFAIVCRENDSEIKEILKHLNDPNAEAAISAERALLQAFGGGCQVPLGAYATVKNSILELNACVVHPDGKPFYRSALKGGVDQAKVLGKKLADKMISQGAGEIIDFVLNNP